ncbi:MAG: dTDP-4-dehydrorhamnose reductase [Actinomycetota bacterium]
MGLGTAVLVTGAGGQVGAALRAIRPEWTYLTRRDLDVTDEAAMRRVVSEPCVVVHLAAFTNVDACEADPGYAEAVNAKATQELARRAQDVEARIVYLSTDYVFDGKKSSEYFEDDATNPLNQYGRTKLEGERAVAANGQNVIVRTSWVFGEGRNFIRAIVQAAHTRSRLEVVADQRGRPTAAADVAAALVPIVEEGRPGVVHVAGDGDPATWAEVARVALHAAGRRAEVVEIDSETWERRASGPVARRPKNSVLSLERARSLSLPLFDWRESAIAYAKEIA